MNVVVYVDSELTLVYQRGHYQTGIGILRLASVELSLKRLSPLQCFDSSPLPLVAPNFLSHLIVQRPHLTPDAVFNARICMSRPIMTCIKQPVACLL